MSRFASFSLCGLAAASSRPNILFVLADDMGWGDVSYNKEMHQPGAGGEKWTVNPPRTPNIDSLALGQGTMLFRRFYSGSAVCSPTRASILTGRTPKRSCIDSAESCGTAPAWNCYGKLPLPTTEFTVAEAAKSKNYSTIFVGKWHLGDFWMKDGRPSTFATDKWPSSHPGLHGFDEWHATEASAPSTSTNCGCDAAWKSQGKGCITGGGVWKDKANECTNYWNFAASKPATQCLNSSSTDRACVANLTSKIEGDDSEYIMDHFEGFLKRKAEGGPWLAQLSLHTNHEPHPSLPEWYNAYKEAEGGPAGDYHGTISQMDAAMGRLVDMLKQHGQYDNTMIWYTADNGAHTGGRPSGQLSASNGLRQCKASLFEGGIRVAGFVHWPAVIKGHQETMHAAVTTDFLPTVLDLLSLQHPEPSWASDGMSLLPLLRGDTAPTTARSQGIGFSLHAQMAWQEDFGAEGVWKIIVNPNKGQCQVFSEPYGSMESRKGPFLFNLTADPTEEKDLCAKFSDRCEAMKMALDKFSDSIDTSRVSESGCAPRGPSPPPPSPTPTGGFALSTADGHCLTVQSLVRHGVLEVDACDEGSRWEDKKGYLTNLAADASLQCLKLDKADNKNPCIEGNTLWLGKCAEGDPGFDVDADGHLVTALCPGMCAVPAPESIMGYYSSAPVALGKCTASAFAFQKTASVALV